MELVSTMEISGEEREIADAYARGQIATNAQSIATNAEGIAGLNNNLDDIEFLGWSVPSECPIQNYVDADGVFHQRVGRVDLGSLNWTYNNHFGTNAVVFHRVFSDAKGYGVDVEPNIYCSKYTSTKVNTIANGMQDKSIAIWDHDNNIIICDTSYTDATAFKNAMQGVYLYYELETEKTIAVGSEAVAVLKSDLSAQSKVVGKHDKIINTPNVATVSGMSYNAEADEIIISAEQKADETIADRLSWHDNALNGIYDTMTALKEKTDSDLGGLKFSASGTTLTITDGANTWRLTAN